MAVLGFVSLRRNNLPPVSGSISVPSMPSSPVLLLQLLFLSSPLPAWLAGATCSSPGFDHIQTYVCMQMNPHRQPQPSLACRTLEVRSCLSNSFDVCIWKSTKVWNSTLPSSRSPSTWLLRQKLRPLFSCRSPSHRQSISTFTGDTSPQGFLNPRLSHGDDHY